MSERRRSSVAGVLAAVVVLGTATGCGIFDDAARVARAGSGDALSAGAALGDEATKLVPRRGGTLRAGIRTLSDDPTVQDASYGLSWDVMCDVVTQSLPSSLNDVVGYVLLAAASYALEFTDEGARVLGEAILDEIGDEGSAVREECGALQP